jgi:hypothetical protein
MVLKVKDRKKKHLKRVSIGKSTGEGAKMVEE